MFYEDFRINVCKETEKGAVTRHPTEKEAYDFFTFNFEPVRVQKKKNNLKKKKQKVPPSVELKKTIKPLNLEDEGVSVGRRPVVSIANKNISEMEEGKKRFGDNDWILALPDPIKKYSTRPPLVHMEDLDRALQTKFTKALMAKDRDLNIAGGADLEGYHQLSVNVSGLIFSHHPLFSREHVLGACLTQLYEQYLTRQHKNLTQRLTDKLKQLRRKLHNLLDIECGQIVNQALQRKISVYAGKVRNTREQRDTQQEKDRTLLKNIVKVWKELKALRVLQKFTSTPYKLRFRRETVNGESDEREHEEEILAEVEELLAEHEEKYMRDWAEYTEQLEEWKRWRKTQKAKKGLSKRNGQAGDIEEEWETDEAEDPTEEGPMKPERPKLPDSDSLEQWVREKASRIRRKPGEPILIPQLSASGEITATKLCPRAERARRRDLSGRSLFIKIFCNEKEVSQIDSCALNDDFRVHFGQIFSLMIPNCPQSINLQVFEKTESSCSLLAQVFVPVPEPSVLTGNSRPGEFEFSSNQRVTFDHGGVGSGVPLSFVEDGRSNQTPLTSGKLWCSVSRVIGEDGEPLGLSVSQQPAGIHSGLARLDAVASIAASGLYDKKVICEWATQSQLDRGDLNDASTMQLLKVACSGEVSAPEYFRLEHLQEEFNFVTDEEIGKSRRFRLLRLRNSEVAEFRNYKFVPAHEREVPDQVFQDYEKRVRGGVVIDSKEHLDSRRALAAQNLQRIRESIIHRLQLAKPRYRLSDLVVEGEKLNMRSLGNILPFKRKSLLKTRRTERKKVTAQNLSDGDVKLLVNVIRAYGIPVRKVPSNKPRKSFKTATRASGSYFRQVQVRPFVEVSFQQTVLQTTTADGPNPCWNEELQLPFCAPNGDYSTASLKHIKDKVLINIFDEVALESGGSDEGKGIQTRVEKRWLGSVRIPFSAIYSQLKIESTIRVNMPAVPVGYRKQRNYRPNGGRDILWSRSKGTFITLLITIEPQLVPRRFIREKFYSQGDERLLKASDRFEKKAAQDYPDRPCTTTVIGLNGEAVFITRFIRPLKPPNKCLKKFPNNPREAMTRVARFVSLIPSLPDQDSGSYKIWSTCDQFLKFRAGDEEHAVLLCNYFLFMGKQAWLIIGCALPEGPTAYVLTLEQDRYLIWNPRTGQCYSQHDTKCPLQIIGCLVNADNVWFNIQQHTTPTMMSFDVRKGKYWKPFFSRSFPQPGLWSVQPDKLVYRRTNIAAVKELQDRIGKILKEKIMEWRPRHPTRWNRYCSSTLQKLLPRLEQCVTQDMANTHCKDLQNMLGDYKISGFPLCLPFSGMQPIIEAVYRTGVHSIRAPSTEFALAVHVHPYPNDVLSVWVHLVSLLSP